MKSPSLVDLAVLTRSDEQCAKAFTELGRFRQGDRNRLCRYCNTNPVGRPYGFQCEECRLKRQREINMRRSNVDRRAEHKKRTADRKKRRDLLTRYQHGEF